MSLVELFRRNQDFTRNGEVMTDRYYAGTHQIVVSGDCVNLALDALENIDGVEIFFYDDDYYCYIVAPELDEKSFFEQVVSVVETAVSGVLDEEGTYAVRRKIPATPALPDQSSVASERVDGVPCYKATVHLGRGYGTRYSRVDILMSNIGRKVFYRVQRFNNDVAGPQEDGEAKIFGGVGAQWQAVCFAYGIAPSEGDTKEAAQRAKKFVYAVVGELMGRFWSNTTQPSFMDAWRQGRQNHPVMASV